MSLGNHIDTKYSRESWLRALQRTASVERGQPTTLSILIDQWAEQHGDDPALTSPEASMSYRSLSKRCHQYSHWGVSQGLKSGDVVVLFMQNCADYLPIWMGLTRISVTVALVNHHLIGDLLAHSVAKVAPKAAIISAELAEAFDAVRASLPFLNQCWVHGSSGHGMAEILSVIKSASCEPLSVAERPLPTLDTTALFIFTSGTTGLPKAAKVSHYRVLQWSQWFAGLLDIRPEDRMYNCLPLYHSVGGIVASGATLVGGGCLVIRPRFSASNFWRDVQAERCTLFQYIGELCRHLATAPHEDRETRHMLRIACGNGLRPEVWAPFKERFRIPRIVEYYASTEGNFSLFNCEGEPGAVGKIPPFISRRAPVALLRVDTTTHRPMRSESGFCEACGTDEVGEAVARISDTLETRSGRFEGYTDAKASKDKMLRDVFASGDLWYRSGDLMRRDARGFYYFVDRVGDTFRWKGENVSTSEVFSVLSSCPGVLDGVVYGVSVAGADGRAGMATLVVAEAFNVPALHAHAKERLPSFARPMFLRLSTALPRTATFKVRKQDLMADGFDPLKIHDPLYFDDPRVNRYVVLDAPLYAEIMLRGPSLKRAALRP